MRTIFTLVWIGLILDGTRLLTTALPVPVLLIHGIDTKRGSNDFWTLDPARFEQLISALKAAGYRTLDQSELNRALLGTLPAGESSRRFVFTVDDGLSSVASRIVPRFDQAGFTGFFFVCPGLGPPQHLDGPSIKELSHHHVVGAHGHTHVTLSPTHRPSASRRRADEIERIRDELEQSRSALEATVDHPVTFMAYPRGEYDSTTLELARAAGYDLAFTTDIGYVDASTLRMEIPRLQILQDMPVSMILAFLGTPERERTRRLVLESALFLLLSCYLIGTRTRRPPENLLREAPLPVNPSSANS